MRLSKLRRVVTTSQAAAQAGADEGQAQAQQSVADSIVGLQGWLRKAEDAAHQTTADAQAARRAQRTAERARMELQQVFDLTTQPVCFKF